MNTDVSTVQVAASGAELIGLLSEQCGLYEQLAGLSESQRALITGDEPQRLLALLGQRQRLLDQADQLAARMRPYQKSWPDLRSRVGPEEAEQVDRLLDRMNVLLAGILEKDKADAQLLAARKSATGQEMAAIKAGRLAGAAYVAAAYGAAAQRDWAEE